MSVLGSRELSQFGSFLYIDDTTRSVGIATTASPNIGLGTANPQYKVHVVGTANIDGALYLNGAQVIDATTERWSSGTGSDIYRLIGDVGIGTTNPTYKLHVVGDSYNQGTFYSDYITVYNSFTVSSANTSSVNARSGGSLSYCGFSLGRTVAEGTLSVSGGAGQFSSNSIAGDIVLRTENLTSKLLFNNSLSDAVLAIYQNNALVGTLSSTGVSNQKLQVGTSAYVKESLGVGASETNTAGSGQIIGGFGAFSTSGTLDWNSSTNARGGNGYSLLLGNATNGPGAAYGSYYYHPFSFEYSSKNGTGNLTQLGIPYGATDADLGAGILYRSRFGGTWKSWYRTLSQPASITGVNISATGNLGVNVANPTTTLDVSGNANFIGVVTATTFSGSGSRLNNVLSYVGLRTETGGNIGTGATIFQFVGAAVSSVSVSSGIATISLKFSDTTSLLNKTGDTMSGALGVTVGTAAAPSVYFNGFTNTGLYSPGANRFGVSCSGGLVLDVTATGITVTGNIAKSGGTSSQFLKANGSVDSTTYASTGRAVAMALVFGG